jgi:GT2 family glycosyltransferase
MRVSWIEPGAGLNMQREQVVICIPVYGAHEHFAGCLGSVLANTSPEFKILICDDASPDTRSAELVAELAATSPSHHEVFYLRRQRNLGFPGNVNGAFDAAAPADVVVLNSDCQVSGGWLEGLRAAAYADSRVATATALSNNGTIVSVPHRGRPSPSLPPGWTLDEAAAAVRSASLRLRPRLPTAVGHCVYVRRSALELVGGFDLAFTPGYGEEVDFSQRCIQAGLAHVLADDVLVFHHGGASLSLQGQQNPSQERNERLLAERYPHYHRAVAEAERDQVGPLARALSAARRALCGISVVIDARVLDGPMTGTQIQVLEVIAALTRTGQLHLTLIMPRKPTEAVRRILTGLPDVRLIDSESVAEQRGPRADVVHRPYQVGSHEDIAFLAPLAERLIITNQDLISFENPSYFRNAYAWEGYRQITKSALALADHVVFISGHGRDEALWADLLEEGRASVVHNGVDHALLRPATADSVPPPGSERLPPEAPVLLCLGTDFQHKNRLFAIRLLARLRERYGWTGHLVFAGPHITHGSSAAQERTWLSEHPEVAGAVLDVSAVSEEGKAWLYDRCSLVLYPTVYEGFGLIPFEAADHGRPCLWAPATALGEILPLDAASIVPWNVELTAEKAIALLQDGDARKRNLEAIRSASRTLSWDRAAAELVRIYREVCDAPPSPASMLERRDGIMAGLLSPDAMHLIGPDGALPYDIQRPLLALATHSIFARPVFGAIRLGYRAGYGWRRRWRQPPAGRSPSGRLS